MKSPKIEDYIAQWPLLGVDSAAPWAVVEDCESRILELLETLGPGYRRHNNCAIHETAIVEQGAVLKGAIIIGEGCFVAAGAYLRGGVYLGKNCIVGPSCELKSTFMLDGSKLDGADIKIRHENQVIETGVSKFGALVGDGCKIGANAVIAPGALLRPHTRVPRLGLIDQFAYE